MSNLPLDDNAIVTWTTGRAATSCTVRTARDMIRPRWLESGRSEDDFERWLFEHVMPDAGA